jgi:hypothetical protein
MVENQRNMTIDLHIKTLCMKVTEHTPVYVIWQRGNKFDPYFIILTVHLHDINIDILQVIRRLRQRVDC